MIPGTGPGRGLPWWRWWRVRRLFVRHQPGLDQTYGFTRPGRVVAKIGAKR